MSLKMMNHLLHLPAKKWCRSRRRPRLLNKRIRDKFKDSILSPRLDLVELCLIEAGEEEEVEELHQVEHQGHSVVHLQKQRNRLLRRNLILNYLRLPLISQPQKDQNLKISKLPIQTLKKTTREIAQSNPSTTTTKKESRCGNKITKSSKKR